MNLIPLVRLWNPADIVERLTAIPPLPKGDLNRLGSGLRKLPRRQRPVGPNERERVSPRRGEGEPATRPLPISITVRRTNISPPPPGSADWQSAVSPAGSRLVDPAFIALAIVESLRTIPRFDYWNLIILWSLDVGTWSLSPSVFIRG